MEVSEEKYFEEEIHLETYDKTKENASFFKEFLKDHWEFYKAVLGGVKEAPILGHWSTWRVLVLGNWRFSYDFISPIHWNQTKNIAISTDASTYKNF